MRLLVPLHSDCCAHCGAHHRSMRCGRPGSDPRTGSSCRACRRPDPRKHAWRRNQQQCHQGRYRTDNPTFHGLRISVLGPTAKGR